LEWGTFVCDHPKAYKNGFESLIFAFPFTVKQVIPP